MHQPLASLPGMSQFDGKLHALKRVASFKTSSPARQARRGREKLCGAKRAGAHVLRTEVDEENGQEYTFYGSYDAERRATLGEALLLLCAKDAHVGGKECRHGVGY